MNNTFDHNHKNRKRAGTLGTKTCFVTKAEHPRSDMLRFVLSPDRVVVFDVCEKLPGHGFWLTANRDILSQAVDKRLFYKAAKGTVQIPSDLADTVLTALKNRCLNLLALCRKAGLLVFGFEAVKKAITAHQVVAVFESTDSSERGQNKLIRPDDTFLLFSLFTRSELGSITGFDDVVHMALTTGTLSQQAIQIAQKINLYMQQEQKG